MQALNLLIVEDVTEDVELIALTLESAQISLTYDVADNTTLYRQLLHDKTYDVVVSDYQLPSFSGLQAFELLKQSAQNIPFILITDSLGEEAAVECIKGGMTDYVLKDRLFRLPTALNRALQEFELRRQKQAAILQIQQQAWRDASISRIIREIHETLVLDKVLQTTVNQLHDVFQVTKCFIIQPDGAGQMRLTHLNQSDSEYKLSVGIPFTCMSYRDNQDSLLQGKLVISSKKDGYITLKIKDSVHGYQYHSLVLAPLLYQQSYRGCIGLCECSRGRHWNDYELTLIESIAHQCAIAIHQAELYQKAQTELSELQKIEEKLRHDAFYDTLTGRPNRRLFLERLRKVLLLSQGRSRQDSNEPPYRFAVLFLDLERLKVINDSLGHVIGDQLLEMAAQRFSSCLRIRDTVARLSGGEFAILLEEISEINDAIEVIHRIHQALRLPFLFDNHEIFISASIGVAFSADHYTEPMQLLRDANTAMYRSRGKGRDSYEIFDASMHAHGLEELQLETDLQRAIERQELAVYYQPIVSLSTNRICGFEALVRWRHPERGIIYPTEFIAVAEETGLIMSIDWWVLREACRQLRYWQEEFPAFASLGMNVNLSGKQFSRPDLITQIDRVLEETQLDGGSLKLEMTESVLIENAEVALEIFEQLKVRRIQVCLDDFGTGYSSLSYLRRFPIHTLKIDRSFITRLGIDSEDSEIVKAIVSLGLTLGLRVVAEGVETPSQLSFLRTINCHESQGYYFSRPVDSETAGHLLQDPIIAKLRYGTI
ncbi:MAG: EAL domain-containing protein [Leptolyngbyaceae cyanobacterium MO_188.B28]|nr:EAL domain-containing protein [Leptolyngbyaceae cyanobacterium MO_188.B28]